MLYVNLFQWSLQMLVSEMFHRKMIRVGLCRLNSDIHFHQISHVLEGRIKNKIMLLLQEIEIIKYY